MQVVVYGNSYTGAHFRGIPDPIDSRDVKMVLVGEESNIVRYLLQNFFYDDNAVTTMAALTAGIKNYLATADTYDETVPSVGSFDDCGGIIVIEGDASLDLQSEEGGFTFLKELPDGTWEEEPHTAHTFVDLGHIEVNAFSDPSNHVNHLLKEMQKAGTLPTRDRDHRPPPSASMMMNHPSKY